LRRRQFLRIIAAITAIILIIGSCSMFRYARTSDPLSDPIFNKLMINKKLNDGSRLYESGDNYELYIKKHDESFLTRAIIYSDDEIIYEIGENPYMPAVTIDDGFMYISLMINTDEQKVLFLNPLTKEVNRNWYWAIYKVINYDANFKCVVDYRDDRYALVDLFDINQLCYEIDAEPGAYFIDIELADRNNVFITYKDLDGNLITKEFNDENCSYEHRKNLIKYEHKLKCTTEVNFTDSIFYEIKHGMSYSQIKNIVESHGELIYEDKQSSFAMYGYLSERFEIYIALEFDKLIDISRYSRNLSN